MIIDWTVIKYYIIILFCTFLCCITNGLMIVVLLCTGPLDAVTGAVDSMRQFLIDSSQTITVDAARLRSTGRSIESILPDLTQCMEQKRIRVNIVGVDTAWKLVVTGLGELAVHKANAEVSNFIGSVLEKELHVPLPESWGIDDRETEVSLAELYPSQPEYAMAANCLLEKDFPGEIVRVERVQNPELYRLYHKKRKEVANQNNGDANEALLKHGTRLTDPKIVWDSGSHTNTYGFDFRHSSDNNFYGRGSYFTDDAAYTHNYSYHPPSSTGDSKERQVFLALVAQGLSEQKETKDQRTGIKIASPGFQSIRGPISGPLQGVVVYELNQCYPAYLITYRTK
jgi:hypothetical protein